MLALLTQVLNGLSFGALLFILSSGFTVTYGLMRIVNLAHGAFYLVGGYVGYTIAGSPNRFWLALLVGGLSMGVLGLITERVLLRPIRHQVLPEVLLTVGLAIVLADLSLASWGGNPTSIPLPSVLSGAIDLGPIAYPRFRLAVALFAIVIGILLFVLQSRTRVGAIVRAGVDDREMVAALGIDVDRVFSGVFVLGAFLAGLSGVIGGALLTLQPGADTTILLYALVVVILGGAGSLGGAAVGAAIVGVVDAFTKAYLPQLSYFTLFAPMLLVLVFRPQGLLGRST